MSPYLLEACQSLWATRRRSALALVGIVIGIASVISMVSIGKIIGAEAAREFESLGTDLVSVRIRGHGGRVPLVRRILELPRHTPCVVAMSPSRIDSVEPVRSTPALFEDRSEIEVVATSGEFLELAGLSLASGRFLSNLDSPERFVVLGSELARALERRHPTQAVVGSSVTLDGRGFEVVGTLAPAGELGMIRVAPDESAFTLARAERDVPGRVATAVGRIRSSSAADSCGRRIERYFERRAPDADVTVQTAQALIDQMRRQANLMSTLLAAIGSIALILGGVGIMNIMLVSVAGRQQEIGIRRALGAQRQDIRLQFLLESLVLSVIGGVLGILVSLVTTWAVARHNEWEYFVSPMSILLGAGVSLAVGIVFGLLPAHQAAGLEPIESLRAD